MVFGLIDSFGALFANPKKRWEDSRLSRYYMQEGFNESEASGISWVVEHRARGEGVGALLGLFVAYHQRRRFVNLSYR